MASAGELLLQLSSSLSHVNQKLSAHSSDSYWQTLLCPETCAGSGRRPPEVILGLVFQKPLAHKSGK